MGYCAEIRGAFEPRPLRPGFFIAANLVTTTQRRRVVFFAGDDRRPGFFAAGFFDFFAEAPAMCLIMASPNAELLTSFAPFMRRAKS